MSDPGSDEERLLELARAGDQEALGALLELQRPRVRGLLGQMLGIRPEIDLDDLVQEARLRAMRALDGFRGGSSFGTWICRIAMNLAISELRKRRLRDAAPLPPEDLLPRGDDEEPWVHAERTELRERLAAAVDGLPPAMRQVFDLKYRHGLSGTEVAARLGIPAATVRTRIFHARRRLREALDDLVS